MAPGWEDLSIGDIRNFLRGIDFPCSKQELITNAEDNGAPQNIIDMLDKLPDQQYNSMTDVLKATGQAIF